MDHTTGFSDFSINAILGLPKKTSSCCSCSPRSSLSSDAESEPEDPVGTYLKSLALQQIQLARLQLLPPAWSQRQQSNASASLEKNSSSSKRKYDKGQTEILLRKYKARPYVTREEMSELSNQTCLSMHQVKIWFQNRRLKDRKRFQKL